MNTYGALSPRTSAYVVKDLLDRGTPYYVFEKFGMSKPLPSNSTKTMSFRRYFLGVNAFTENGSKFNPYEYLENNSDTGEVFNVAANTLTEGITPAPVDLDTEDTTVTIAQYGTWTQITDVIQDTHEDPVLREAVDILGETGAYLAEKVRFNVLKAGSNVFYACTNATKSRANVDSVMSLDLQRAVIRSLKRNLARPITSVVKSSAAYGTEAISPAFVAVIHPDLESDIRNMDGFTPAEKYGTTSPMEGEIGKVESVRYIVSTVVSSYGAEGASTTSGIYGDGSNNYVYPILIFAKDAYAVVPLKGKSSIVPMVLNPGIPREGDPLGQRGSVAIKFWHACLILQDAWMARVEVAASDLY